MWAPRSPGRHGRSDPGSCRSPRSGRSRPHGGPAGRGPPHPPLDGPGPSRPPPGGLAPGGLPPGGLPCPSPGEPPPGGKRRVGRSAGREAHGGASRRPPDVSSFVRGRQSPPPRPCPGPHDDRSLAGRGPGPAVRRPGFPGPRTWGRSPKGRSLPGPRPSLPGPRPSLPGPRPSLPGPRPSLRNPNPALPPGRPVEPPVAPPGLRRPLPPPAPCWPRGPRSSGPCPRGAPRRPGGRPS